MELVIEQPVAVFDLTQIGPGCLLWGKHCSWDDGRAGFVTSATDSQLIVQYHPGIGNVTNHFIVPIAEAAAGEWEIRWSADLTVIQEYNITADDEEQETETEGDDETGGTDI